MDVAEITTRLVRRFGPEVAGWCAGVPRLAEHAATRWGLTLGETFPGGASSVAAQCVWPDGTAAVLKMSPDPAFLAEQVTMLWLFAPSGRVPAILADDADLGIVVMEAVEPGTMADAMADPPTPEAWAALLEDLHTVPPPVDPPRTLRARCEEAYDRIGKLLDDPVYAGRIGPADLEKAMRRCDALLASGTEHVVLHGDLHLGNVLDGGQVRGLVAIDPKVCVGDPCFDAADYALAGAGADGIGFRSDATAKAADLSADRLREWCRAIAPLTAMALLRTGSADAAVAELLEFAS